MQTVALVDYGCGNLPSASKALTRASGEIGTEIRVEITASPDLIAKADRIVLPGVGHFQDCALALRSRDGVIDALTDAVLSGAVPFLGICVGMQLLATNGLEDGETPGLDWISGTVERLADSPGLRIPHMGWNTVTPEKGIDAIIDDLGEDAHFYFVHSYAFRPSENHTDSVLAVTDYGQTFPAIIGRDNILGTQFHPEKSQAAGLQLLANWLTWSP